MGISSMVFFRLAKCGLGDKYLYSSNLIAIIINKGCKLVNDIIE